MSSIMLIAAILYCYAGCRYAECRYAECRGGILSMRLAGKFKPLRKWDNAGFSDNYKQSCAISFVMTCFNSIKGEKCLNE
jgi:hypothetical protein